MRDVNEYTKLRGKDLSNQINAMGIAGSGSVYENLGLLHDMEDFILSMGRYDDMRIGSNFVDVTIDENAVTLVVPESGSIVSDATATNGTESTPTVKRKGKAKPNDTPEPSEGIHLPTLDKNAILGYEREKTWIRTAIKLRKHVILEGMPGTGKTSVVEELAKEYGRPFSRVNLDGNTDRGAFVGERLVRVKDGAPETYFVDGVLITAMIEGHFLLVDEINAALPEVLFVLQTLLDGGNFVRITEDENRILRPHDNFRFFAAMNPTDSHVGTKELNRALRDRFACKVKFDYLNPKDETIVVTGKTGIDTVQATLMVSFANQIRTLRKSQTIDETVSTRALLDWGMFAVETGDLNGSFEFVILNGANGDSKIFQQTWKSIKTDFDLVAKEFGDTPANLLESIRKDMTTIQEEKALNDKLAVVLSDRAQELDRKERELEEKRANLKQEVMQRISEMIETN